MSLCPHFKAYFSQSLEASSTARTPCNCFAPLSKVLTSTTFRSSRFLKCSATSSSVMSGGTPFTFTVKSVAKGMPQVGQRERERDTYGGWRGRERASERTGGKTFSKRAEETGDNQDPFLVSAIADINCLVLLVHTRCSPGRLGSAVSNSRLT